MKFQPKLFKDFFDELVDECDNGKRREATIEDYRSFGATLLVPALGKFTLTDISDAVSHTKRYLCGLFEIR